MIKSSNFIQYYTEIRGWWKHEKQDKNEWTYEGERKFFIKNK